MLIQDQSCLQSPINPSRQSTAASLTGEFINLKKSTSLIYREFSVCRKERTWICRLFSPPRKPARRPSSHRSVMASDYILRLMCGRVVSDLIVCSSFLSWHQDYTVSISEVIKHVFLSDRADIPVTEKSAALRYLFVQVGLGNI